jgi:hypothetical protein
MAPRLSTGKPESVVSAALERHLQSQEASGTRIVIRIVKYSIQLSDKTNLYAGYKQLEDQLRYSGLIPNDDPETISIEITQIKVSHRRESGTWIEIAYPEEHLDL